MTILSIYPNKLTQPRVSQNTLTSRDNVVQFAWDPVGSDKQYKPLSRDVGVFWDTLMSRPSPLRAFQFPDLYSKTLTSFSCQLSTPI